MSRCVSVFRCEQVVLVSTSLLCAAVRLVQSSCLLDQIVHFLLRTPSLMELLLQRCDHISDQVSPLQQDTPTHLATCPLSLSLCVLRSA